jgi:glycosyltransferase involved in cell wall biosynthesis
MSTKKRIMLFTDWYEPGFRAGGPIRSCVNFVQHMQDRYKILVFTSDRDLESKESYDNIPLDSWTPANGKADVHLYYCSPGKLTYKNIRKQIRDLAPEFIYLNSMFSRNFSLYPVMIHRTAALRSKLILAPRGMLRASAVQFKWVKKKIFLSLFRIMGFPRKIHFQATDETEVGDIQKFFGRSADITMLTNFPALVSESLVPISKTPGMLRMIFIGRIHPIKNLDYLLGSLMNLSAVIELSIIGSMEDAAYWSKCQEIIRSLGSNISVNYLGEMPAAEIPLRIQEHHLFILPTRGENFGHAILEALLQGRPVLISDQTPWKNLEQRKAGWDLPLDEQALFQKKIEQVASMNQMEFDDLSLHARQYAEAFMEAKNLKEEYQKLFN